MQTAWNRVRPDKISGGIPETFFSKKMILEKKTADDKKQPFLDWGVAWGVSNIQYLFKHTPN